MEHLPVKLGIQVRLQNIFQRAQLRFLFGLERAGIFEHLSIAIPENVRGEPSAQAQHARFEGRRQHRLHQGLPGLEVLAANGHVVFQRQLLHRWKIDRQVRRPIGKRDAAGNGSPCVQHRRGNRRVIRLHGLDKFLRRRVDFLGLQENLGRTAPAGHQPRNFAGLLEVGDVFLDLQCEFVLVLALLHVRAVQLLHIFGIERCFHRLDAGKERLHFCQVLEAQYACVGGGLEGVVFVNIPARENQIVQIS